MIKFFEVIAKCGHVGRNFYYEGAFYVRANSASEAAQGVKKRARVKSDHADGILQVTELTYSEYIEGRKEEVNDPYFNCFSKYEQNAVWEQIEKNVRPETENQLKYRKMHSKNRFYHKKDEKVNKKGIRNPYKYAKYNQLFDVKYEQIRA